MMQALPRPLGRIVFIEGHSSENLTPWIWDKPLVDSHALASDPLDTLIPQYYQQVADLKTIR